MGETVNWRGSRQELMQFHLKTDMSPSFLCDYKFIPIDRFVKKSYTACHQLYYGIPPMNNPFLTIWFRPRATLRHIIATNTSHYVIPLAMLMGVTNALDRATEGRFGNER